jgi:dTDP-4-dehydrorhamnose reductase
MSGPRRVLILGGNGQVGRAVHRAGPEGGSISLGRDEADVTDFAAIERALDRHRPEVVINAAVFQPVDLCESAVSSAFAVNALAPGALAASCGERGARLIHLSTDYVFSGPQRTPFSEGDCPAPLNVYAHSKLAGEHLVLAAGPRHCVVRTSSVYGRAAPGARVLSFVARMMERARKGEATRVVDDQVVSPTCADDLAVALWGLVGRDAAGLFHMAGSTPGTWYEVAETVFAFAGRRDLLGRTTSAEFGAPAIRAPYTAMCSTRLDEVGLDALPGFETALPKHLESTYAR